MAGVYRFDRFVLDAADRRLSDAAGSVELSSRYLDALVLLVAEEGRLVTKARLLDEVWKGVPVTDEALTQCVRSLRKALGDEAGRPRFIETVLFGSAPKAMTGAGEGLLLGAAIGAGVWIAQGRRQRIALLAGAGLTCFAGAAAELFGGRLMGGSLAALAAQFPRAQLRLDHLGTLFGEATFGVVSQAATAGVEGALFGAAMVWALNREQRQ